MFKDYLNKRISTPIAITIILIIAILAGGLTYWQYSGIQKGGIEMPEIEIPRKANESGNSFPLTPHFVNEKDALLFRVVFDSLPPYLVIQDKEILKKFIETYLDSWIKNKEDPDYQIAKPGLRFTSYHSSIDDLCWTDTILHEYAHALDKRVSHIPELTRIETSDFYSISYKLSLHGYDFIRPDNIANEFVTHYGAYGGQDVRGHRFFPWEDFAESFTMYVSQGVVFRELALQDPYMGQKYNFLKQVFQEKEYDSGDIRGLRAVKEALSPYVVHAQHPCDYTWRIPDEEWDYGF